MGGNEGKYTWNFWNMASQKIPAYDRNDFTMIQGTLYKKSHLSISPV